MLGQARVQHGFRHILISGVLSEAVHVFIRYLSSSREGEKELNPWRKRRFIFNYMKLWKSLVHICRDGCRTIGPWDQKLKGSHAVCKFPACKGVELLAPFFSMQIAGARWLRHFFELHSRTCSTPETCRVPLCRHFKMKMQHLSKNEKIKWDILLESKGTISSIPARRKLKFKAIGSCPAV